MHILFNKCKEEDTLASIETVTLGTVRHLSVSRVYYYYASVSRTCTKYISGQTYRTVLPSIHFRGFSCVKENSTMRKQQVTKG